MEREDPLQPERAEEIQAQLRATERRYQALVEQLPAAVYIESLDESVPTTYVSPQVEEILGYPRQDWLTQPALWEKLMHPLDLDRIRAAWDRTEETGEQFSEEYRALARDGRIVWIREESVILGWGDPDVPTVIHGVMFDITASKNAEEELHRAWEREREAAEHLRQLDAMKNTLLHAVSHDLRGPIAGVLGAAVLLRMGESDRLTPDERADVIDGLEASAAKMSRIVTDLLDLDRMERGILEPKRSTVDVLRLVRHAAHELERDRDLELGPGSIEIGVDPTGVSTEYDLDEVRVERIVENLLRNAIRHTPDETPVWVRILPESEGVTIAVEDAGPGVPKDEAETIFEAYRGSGGEGSGLGLSVVARFAELHGGRAWVEDRDGGGASFRVWLPGA